MNAEVLYFFELWDSLLVCGLTHYNFTSFFIYLMFLSAFPIFSITGKNYTVLAKNYATVLNVNSINFTVCHFKQMIHNYMEHLERTKLHQLTGGEQLESTTHSRIR